MLPDNVLLGNDCDRLTLFHLSNKVDKLLIIHQMFFLLLL
jgi:hypothetical protein